MNKKSLKVMAAIAVAFSICAVILVVLNEYGASAYEIPPTTGVSGHDNWISPLEVGVALLFGVVAVAVFYLILRRSSMPPGGCGNEYV